MNKIAIVTGSTRPGRLNLSVAQWVLERAQQRGDAEYEIVDIQDFNLPVLDEPFPAAYQNYQQEHTKAWAAKLEEFDGYIFITGEYNHSVQPALANALSYVNLELNNKPPASWATARPWRPRDRAPARDALRTAGRPRAEDRAVLPVH
ncbi:NADPH-dependent FMN reductase [Arthrobacter sp. JCM 19049]|uniref:NADPH-dependent FMN reductase n=1 Tax=Arthrobacter sp. JCM 19049 TaxID=1460643 RepID=UPI000A960737|nr:NAD(P)H-dependent oxidoreductase [Arthrobacter sp. JCM 19049]